MERLINKILKILKGHVKQNIKEIQYNQDEINNMLSQDPSMIDQNELDYKNAYNKDLLNENKDFIKIQFQITEFMEKYGHLFNAGENTESENEEINEDKKMNFFYQTISGKLKFDSMHPHFDNPEFFRELLEYYQEKEDYEKCQELLKIKEFKR